MTSDILVQKKIKRSGTKRKRNTARDFNKGEQERMRVTHTIIMDSMDKIQTYNEKLENAHPVYTSSSQQQVKV